MIFEGHGASVSQTASTLIKGVFSSATNVCDSAIGFVIDEQRGLHSTFPTLMVLSTPLFLPCLYACFKEHDFGLLINLNVLLLCLPFLHFFSFLHYSFITL